MSGNSTSLLSLLRRCVAVRQVTLSTGIQTRGSVLPVSCGFIQTRQHHRWTDTRTPSLPRLSPLGSALKSSQYSLCSKAGTPIEDDYPPLPAYQLDSEPERKEVYIVQAKGFPWACSAEDLLQFFSECRIRDGVKGIHLTVNRQGKPTGQAFIEMEHEEDVCKALEKHRQYLGTRYVEVYEVTNSDAEAMLKKSVQSPASDGVVRVRGLPFSCTEADISLFFSGFEIVEGGVTIVLDRKGRNSGEAYVQFSSQQTADEALQRDRELIGNRYIEVFPSRSSEVHSGRRRTDSASPQPSSVSAARKSIAAAQPNPTTGPQSPAPPPHHVHLRGLPFQTTGEDIVQFFSPLAVSKILVEFGPDGRPSGDADVFFTCHQDAVGAMSRDKLHMDGRYIELFLNSAPETNEG